MSIEMGSPVRSLLGAGMRSRLSGGACGIQITTQPSNYSGVYGTTATFSVTASPAFGSRLKYQWRKDGVDIGGATSASYSTTANWSSNGAAYTCAVSFGCQAVISSSATVTVTQYDNVLQFFKKTDTDDFAYFESRMKCYVQDVGSGSKVLYRGRTASTNGAPSGGLDTTIIPPATMTSVSLMLRLWSPPYSESVDSFNYLNVYLSAGQAPNLFYDTSRLIAQISKASLLSGAASYALPVSEFNSRKGESLRVMLALDTEIDGTANSRYTELEVSENTLSYGRVRFNF